MALKAQAASPVIYCQHIFFLRIYVVAGATAYFSIEEPYFFTQHNCRPELIHFSRSDFIVRDTYRMVVIFIVMVPGAGPDGRFRRLGICVMTFNTFQGHTVYTCRPVRYFISTRMDIFVNKVPVFIDLMTDSAEVYAFGRSS